MTVREFIDKHVATFTDFEVHYMEDGQRTVILYASSQEKLVGFEIYGNFEKFMEIWNSLDFEWLDMELGSVIPSGEKLIIVARR